MSSLIADFHPSAYNNKRAARDSCQLVANSKQFQEVGSELNQQYTRMTLLLNIYIPLNKLSNCYSCYYPFGDGIPHHPLPSSPESIATGCVHELVNMLKYPMTISQYLSMAFSLSFSNHGWSLFTKQSQNCLTHLVEKQLTRTKLNLLHPLWFSLSLLKLRMM